MAILYVQEQGTHVRKRDEQILVTRGSDVLQEVPLNKIEQVVLMGRGVQMSTALLVELMGRGIPVMLTNQRGSRHYATLNAGPSRFGALRLQQIARTSDPAWSLERAREMVLAKIANQRTVLQRSGWAAAAAAIRQIDTTARSIAAAGTIDMLRGYEGAAAAAYFGAWRMTLEKSWGFAGRAFYPPPDPLNALLSFGYTLLLHDVLTAVHFVGLDPYLGMFHAIEPGRPSLALDIMEEFRPRIVDQIALDLLSRNQISQSQFERPANRPDAVHLNAAGRALIIDRYEVLMQASAQLPDGQQTPLRRIILLQVQAFTRVVRGEAAQYSGYIL